MLRLALIAMLFSSGLKLTAQEVFSLDFEAALAPEGWAAGDGEWGQAIGEDGSRYFRFHPASWRDALQSPVLDLSAGYYVLYYSWNEAGNGNPDLVNIRWRAEGGNWQTMAQTGGGNDRTWQRDSVLLGNLPEGNFTLQFEYQSLPRFPSQYFNLDNVRLERVSDVVTGTVPQLSGQLLEVGPVPAGDQLTIRLADPGGSPFVAEVFSVSGSRVWNEGGMAANAAHHIDLRSLAAGPYLLKISHPDGTLTRKILIQ